ncbi:MAG TPA: MFS transporter [Planctomycetota bacterium]|nr:MFS transporter [Planctomycetota bacterium]
MSTDSESSPGGSIFSHSAFNKLFAGSLAGTLGDRIYQMSLIAAANLIFAGSASENKVVQVQIVATIPGLFLYSFSGSLIDTCDRRRLITWIKGLKCIAVLLLVPLLWSVVRLDPDNPDPALQQQLFDMWPVALAAVMLLNVINVPFAPARAAAIPDVAPLEHRSLGASLMATTGLISLLLGSMIGGVLARRTVLGPAITIFVSSALYLIATLFFSRLPDAVAVPANRRGGDAKEAVPPKPSMKEYLAGLWEGLVYALKHFSILGLIFFETVFWTVASAFYVLLLFHARTALQLGPDDRTLFFGLGLGAAGVGLFGGAISVGKICQRVSPIITYTPAILLFAIGMYGVFRSEPVDGHAPYWIYPVMFSLGLGGGMLLGRVDADVLAIADEKIRGRVFAIKSMAFAATILATMLFITEAGMLAQIAPSLAKSLNIAPTGLSDDQKAQIALWMPRALFMCLPLAFIFSWVIDVAINARKPDTELPGQLHLVGFYLLKLLGRFLLKVMFRVEVIGAEKVPATGPVILAANHASFIDPILLGCANERMVQWIMYSSYYRSFGHPIFRFLRCIPVDETGGTAALKAGMRSLKQNAVIGIFPEGRVSADGKLQPAQGGALFLAQRSGATVVPVALKGNHAALPRGAWFPRFSKIKVIYGEPFTVSKELSREQMGEVANKLMVDLAGMLELDPPPKS